MQKYGSNLQKNVKLRIESGRSWDVKVESMEDELFCFSRGWENFAQDVGLKMGEFLVFNLNGGGLSVDVSVYETSGCKKEFPDAKNICWNDKSSSPLYYETVLKLHHRSRVRALQERKLVKNEAKNAERASMQTSQDKSATVEAYAKAYKKASKHYAQIQAVQEQVQPLLLVATYFRVANTT
ncbi:hypothetical protein ACS0TY_004598 [Phlomoides rotata]